MEEEEKIEGRSEKEPEETQEDVNKEAVVGTSAAKQTRTKVTFPTRRRKRFKIDKRLLIVVVILIIGGLAGWFIFTKPEIEKPTEPTPTPLFEETTPTPTPKPVNKDEIKIKVLNGTGIAKEAAFLQEELQGIGYSQIEVGNAENEDYVETEVTFSSSLSQEAVDEITDKLKDLYKEVDKKTSRSLDVDVIIITGYRKGHTPTPPPTPTTTPTEGATPTATPSATPTP